MSGRANTPTSNRPPNTTTDANNASSPRISSRARNASSPAPNNARTNMAPNMEQNMAPGYNYGDNYNNGANPGHTNMGYYMNPQNNNPANVDYLTSSLQNMNAPSEGYVPGYYQMADMGTIPGYYYDSNGNAIPGNYNVPGYYVPTTNATSVGSDSGANVTPAYDPSRLAPPSRSSMPANSSMQGYFAPQDGSIQMPNSAYYPRNSTPMFQGFVVPNTPGAPVYAMPNAPNMPGSAAPSTLYAPSSATPSTLYEPSSATPSTQFAPDLAMPNTSAVPGSAASDTSLFRNYAAVNSPVFHSPSIPNTPVFQSSASVHSLSFRNSAASHTSSLRNSAASHTSSLRNSDTVNSPATPGSAVPHTPAEPGSAVSRSSLFRNIAMPNTPNFRSSAMPSMHNIHNSASVHSLSFRNSAASHTSSLRNSAASHTSSLRNSDTVNSPATPGSAVPHTPAEPGSAVSRSSLFRNTAMPNTPNFRSSAVPGTPNFHSSAMPSMHSTRNSAVPGTPAMPGSAVSGTLDEPSSAVPSSAMPSSLPGSNSNASSPSTPVATGPVGPFTPMIPMFATTPTLPEAPMYVGTPVFLSPADTPFMPTMLATANSVVQSGTFMTPNPRYSRAPPAYTLIPSDSAPVTGGIQTPGRTDIHVTLPDSTLTSNIISETNVAGNSAGTVPLTSEEQEFADWRKVKMTLIKELEKGGVIMIVDLPEHARIAQETGATAVMVIENKETHKYDRQRMTAPRIVQKVIDIVALPVIAQVRLGHTMEARAMEKLGVNLIDECSELGVVNSANQIDKRKFTTPFMCSAEDLPTAVKRIKEGASIIYSKAERDSGDPTDAIGTIKGIHDQIKLLRNSSEAEIDDYARQEEVDSVILNQTIQLNRLPVPFFASGGINTPVDVAHVRRAGCDGVIASTIIFKGLDPVKRAAAIVSACKNFNDNKLIGELSKDFKQAQIE